MTTSKRSTKKTTSPQIRRSDLLPARVGISVTPGEMLRTVRELQELTQTQLATMTRMAQSNLSALETGAREMGRERAAHPSATTTLPA
jgi:predicted transcriptional regulator